MRNIFLAFIGLFLLDQVSAQTFTVTPARAYDYVDGIGVNIHLRFTNTIYYTAFESIVYPRLKELGVRHVRDGIPYREFVSANDTLAIRNRLIKMHDSLGIKVCYCLDSRKVVDTPRLRDSAAYLSIFQQSAQMRQTIQCLEGFNEPDLTIWSWDTAHWHTLTYAIQKGLWNKAHSMTELAGVNVISTSLVTYWSIPSKPNKVAALLPHISGYFDFANFHTYDAGSTNAKMFPANYYDLTKGFMDTVRHGKPWVITETGYENALNWNLPSAPGYNANSYHYLSELASGKYYSVLFMEQFKRGAKRVYGYEFADGNTLDQTHNESNFGLIHTDGTPKPAFTAIKNTIGILKDTGASFTPSPLTYTLSGDVSGISNALYQRSDGHYFLALWQGISKGVCYDFPNFTDLPADSQTVKIVLPFVSPAVSVYQPLVSGSAIYTYTNADTITVQVPDHLLLIEVVPAGGAGAMVRPVAVSGISSMKVVSPLSKSGVHVTLNASEKQKGFLSVYNSAGALLAKYPVVAEKGDNNYDLGCKLVSGVYVAVFRGDKGNISQKFFR